MFCASNPICFLIIVTHFVAKSSHDLDYKSRSDTNHALQIQPSSQEISELPELKYIDLTGNNFSGDIPASFGSFLKYLDLKQLNISYNPFSSSQIPPEIGNLTNLEVLWLTGFNLIGHIPDSLGRLSKLVDLDLAINKLTGPVPSSLTGLSNVVQIELYNNSLTGGGVVKDDVSLNLFTGTFPDELCSLQLESLHIYENEFGGKFPEIISNSSNLNRFSGSLLKDLGKNSPLMWVDVSNNLFSCEIPATLCDKGVCNRF